MNYINEVLNELSFLRNKSNEQVWIVGLKNNKINFKHCIATGTSNRCKGFTFEDIENLLIKNNCKEFIFVHNHPDEHEMIIQSEDDDDTTKFFRRLARKYGYKMVDHIIIGVDCHHSYAKHKWAYDGETYSKVIDLITNKKKIVIRRKPELNSVQA